jgi:hypothetical protein
VLGPYRKRDLIRRNVIANVHRPKQPPPMAQGGAFST